MWVPNSNAARESSRSRNRHDASTLTSSNVMPSDVLQVPRHAVFEQEGAPVVYVNVDGVFEAQRVAVVGSGEGLVAIEGVAEGTEVALLDPTATDRVNQPAAPGAHR